MSLFNERASILESFLGCVFAAAAHLGAVETGLPPFYSDLANQQNWLKPKGAYLNSGLSQHSSASCHNGRLTQKTSSIREKSDRKRESKKSSFSFAKQAPTGLLMARLEVVSYGRVTRMIAVVIALTDRLEGPRKIDNNRLL